MFLKRDLFRLLGQSSSLSRPCGAQSYLRQQVKLYFLVSTKSHTLWQVLLSLLHAEADARPTLPWLHGLHDSI